MKIKTSELIGPALDWAVAKLLEEGDRKITLIRLTSIGWVVEREVEFDSAPNFERFFPSRSWAQGGPIVDREIGNLWKHNKLNPADADVCTAAAYHKAPDGTFVYHEDGPTLLIAAMRCYVASKMGDEVDVPEELA